MASVKVDLIQPYRLRPDVRADLDDVEGRQRRQDEAADAGRAPRVKVRTKDQALRDISEGLIRMVVVQVHGKELGKTDRRIWRRLVDQLDDDAVVLNLDGAEFEWLRKAWGDDKAKPHPADAGHFERFGEALDAAAAILEAERKAEAAPPAEAAR